MVLLFVYSPPIPELCLIQKSLAHPLPQSYNTDSQKHEKRSPSLSAQSTGKGWGVFLTTVSTTHTLGTNGKHEFKEFWKRSSLEQKRFKSVQNN